MPGMVDRLKGVAGRAVDSNPETRFQRDYYSDIDATGARGKRLFDRFEKGASEFNAEDALQRHLASAQQTFKRTWERDVENLRASQVARGRSNTGFAFQDEDRLFEAMAGRFAEVAGAGALQANAQNLQHLGMLGSFGDEHLNRALSARGGEYHTRRAQRLQDKADRRQARADIISSGIGAVGSVLGAIFGRG